MNKKWRKLMTLMGWRDITTGQRVKNWNLVADEIVTENIPHVQQWVIDNLGHIVDIDVKRAFKGFYFEVTAEKTPYTYLKKDRAEQVMAGVYSKEQEMLNERNQA